MINEQQITEKAKEEARRNITDYAPNSYGAGFIDGAKWILKQLQHETTP